MPWEGSFRGIPVHFPVPPYAVQITYMSKVMECLETRQNGVLESPSGTGKTLSLLCPSLAWLEHKKGALKPGDLAPKIIYASNTQLQLTEAMQELKRTKYEYMKAVVLGAPDQMLDNVPVAGAVDAILPMVLMGDADVIFIPTEDFLNLRTRVNLGVNLKNNVIIWDEAHNLGKSCEKASSLQLKSSDLSLCVRELERADLGLLAMDETLQFTPDDVVSLRDKVTKFEKGLNGMSIGSGGNTFEVQRIYRMFEDAGITSGNATQIWNLIEKITQFLIEVDDGVSALTGKGLQVLSALIALLFLNITSDLTPKMNAYKVNVINDSNSASRLLSLWCFSPGLSMNTFKTNAVRCLILTSSTLSPLPPLIKELELDVGVQYESPHLLESEQIFARIVSYGPERELLNGSLQNRYNPKYLSSLGRTIALLITHIPDGVLIFFPSYPVLRKCEEEWQRIGIWSTINEDKPVFIEPREPDAFPTIMEAYCTKVQSKPGAILMGICRGKLSDSVHFSHTMTRAVFVIGLPFPPVRDPKIQLRRKYLDTGYAMNRRNLRGDEWYNIDCLRAVNQVIGRVIRHKNDYGAIFLVDSRFKESKVRNNLSLWVQSHVQDLNQWPNMVQDLKQFVRAAVSKLNSLATPSLGEIDDTVAAVQTGAGSSKLAKLEPNTGHIKTIDETNNSLPPQSNQLSHSMNCSVAANAAGSQAIEKSERFIRRYLAQVQDSLGPTLFPRFVMILTDYRLTWKFQDLLNGLRAIYGKGQYRIQDLVQLRPYISTTDVIAFDKFCEEMSTGRGNRRKL